MTFVLTILFCRLISFLVEISRSWLSRELFLKKPQVVIAAQPTRGVDIGAIEFIHNQIRSARDKGAGVLLISSELDELMTLSDRIVVLYKGKIVGEFSRA